MWPGTAASAKRCAGCPMDSATGRERPDFETGRRSRAKTFPAPPVRADRSWTRTLRIRRAVFRQGRGNQRAAAGRSDSASAFGRARRHFARSSAKTARGTSAGFPAVAFEFAHRQPGSGGNDAAQTAERSCHHGAGRAATDRTSLSPLVEVAVAVASSAEPAAARGDPSYGKRMRLVIRSYRCRLMKRSRNSFAMVCGRFP
jgi:hypothetical protein